jgi:hypothetical protein
MVIFLDICNSKAKNPYIGSLLCGIKYTYILGTRIAKTNMPEAILCFWKFQINAIIKYLRCRNTDF